MFKKKPVEKKQSIIDLLPDIVKSNITMDVLSIVATFKAIPSRVPADMFPGAIGELTSLVSDVASKVGVKAFMGKPADDIIKELQESERVPDFLKELWRAIVTEWSK